MSVAFLHRPSPSQIVNHVRRAAGVAAKVCRARIRSDRLSAFQAVLRVIKVEVVVTTPLSQTMRLEAVGKRYRLSSGLFRLLCLVSVQVIMAIVSITGATVRLTEPYEIVPYTARRAFITA